MQLYIECWQEIYRLYCNNLLEWVCVYFYTKPLLNAVFKADFEPPMGFS